jgi:hypothetical protein
VDDDELSVSARVDVELQVYRTLLAGQAKRFQSIFGRARRRASMGEEARLGTGEKTVVGRH